MNAIAIPQANPNHDYWDGTTGVPCACGGTIEWAEAGYTSGCRACRSCLTLFAVKGGGAERRLVPQMADDGIVRDAPLGTDDEDLYHVPANLYPGWHQEVPAK